MKWPGSRGWKERHGAGEGRAAPPGRRAGLRADRPGGAFRERAKARNADLYAICDVADDLLERMACDARAAGRPIRDYDAMLADPELEAVIDRHLRRLPCPGGADARSRPASTCCARSRSASRSRRSRRWREVVRAVGHVLQVGHMKRFDAGLQSAKALRRRRDGRAARAQGLVLRLHASLRADRRGAAADRHAARSARRPEAIPRPICRALLHARARQPPGRHRPLSGRRDRRGGRPAARALRRLLLVRRRRLRQRRARPSRPDRRRAHGLARGLPDLRRARQRARARPTTPGTTRRATSRSSTRRPRPPPACSAPTGISTGASSRASPTRCWTARRCGRQRRGRHRLGPGHGGDRAIGPDRAARCGSPTCRESSDAARHLRQDLRRDHAGGGSRCGAPGRLRGGPVQHGLLGARAPCPTGSRSATRSRSAWRRPERASRSWPCRPPTT